MSKRCPLKIIFLGFLLIFGLTSVLLIPKNVAADGLPYQVATGPTGGIPRLLVKVEASLTTIAASDLNGTWDIAVCTPDCTTAGHAEPLGRVPVTWPGTNTVAWGPGASPTPSPTPGPGGGGTSGGNFIDYINQEGVRRGTYDDKYFNLNQFAAILDNANFILTGTSRIHPEMTEAAIAYGEGGGAIGNAGGFLAIFAQQPISSFEYFAKVSQDAGLIPTAEAQGFGFQTGLAPILKIWEVFRNLAYAGFVIIFVIFGFMIMFRTRIDAQTVASVQASLPRIIIGLILVTLSYAIAGLMVDLMYVLTGLVANIFGQGTATGSGIIQSRIVEGNIFTAVYASWGSYIDAVKKTLEMAMGAALGDIPVWIKEIVGFATHFAVTSIISVVLAIILLFVVFRIFFILVMAYVGIIIMTIFAPLQFLVSTLPGQSATGWFRGMLANILVFPTVVAMITFAHYIVGGFGGAPTGVFFKAPLLGGLSAEGLRGIIGIGILLMTPKAADMVRQAVGQKAFPFGPDWGPAQAAGAIMAAPFAYLASRNRRQQQQNP